MTRLFSRMLGKRLIVTRKLILSFDLIRKRKNLALSPRNHSMNNREDRSPGSTLDISEHAEIDIDEDVLMDSNAVTHYIDNEGWFVAVSAF